MVSQAAHVWADAVRPVPAARTISRAATADRVAFFGVVFLVLAAPFELQKPLVVLPWQSISNLEACLLLAVGCWAAALVAARAWPAWRTPVTWPWIASIAAMTAASVASTVSRVNGLHMTGRVAAACVIYLLAVNGLRTADRARAAISALVAAAAAAAVLAILEYLRIGAVIAWLHAFRTDFAWVGAQLRADGPFQYPSIASMYLEVAFACGLGLWPTDREGKRPFDGVAATVLFGALLLIGAAIVLTYTRSGLIVIGLSVALVGFLRCRRWGFDSGTTLAAALAMAVGMLVLTSRPAQSLWLRFTTEGQESWYRMSVEAPPEVSFAPDAIMTIPLAVTNLGRATWDSRVSPPFSFTSHWYSADGSRVVAFYGIRNVFPKPVKPGETVTIDTRVRAPREAGTYQLVWDIEYKDRLWFSTEQGAMPNVSRAIVSGAAAPASDSGSAVPRPAVRPGRLVLWAAAARMIRAHPVLGFGPDNFRLAYGTYASLPAADSRVHSNNMYLEIAVGVGLAGCCAFLWLFAEIGRVAFRLATPAAGRATALGFGVAAAIGAIAVHGLFDSFLEFTSTYVLFAIVLGCASALVMGAEPNLSDADRI